MDKSLDTQNEAAITESNAKAEEDDALDPRIQIELERLNHANEAINHLELQLDDARQTLKEFNETSERELYKLEKSIGSAVSKARSYYETRIKLRATKEALTKVKHRFERAQALHLAAKELAIVSAEHIDEAQRSHQIDTTWDETYRQALAKAGDAEREKFQADLDQQRTERVYAEIEKNLEQLGKDSRRSINKSKPYYEMKVEYNKELEFHKRKVCGLENCVNEAKNEYQQSLRTLEHISNEIHAQRNPGMVRQELGERTPSAEEEQVMCIDTKSSIPEPILTTPQPTKPSENILRSCLLRTETLPTGIMTNPHGRSVSESDEMTNGFNNQFILRPKQAPHPTLLPNPEHDTDGPLERAFSFSSRTSELTNEDDNRSGSLHVLSDEQLNHLAYEYHSYSSETTFERDPIDELISQIETSTLQAKMFFRKLFKANNLDN